MAKGKNKLNKTNSSGWLDDYSEELSISQYEDGGKLKQYFKLPTKRVAVDNTYNKNSLKLDSSDDKEMVNRLLREKANESQKAKEKRIADVRRLEELNQKSMLETANAKDLYDIGEGMKSKYRFSNEDNFFDDYINPLNMVGGMAGGLAQTPELINQGEYGNAALNVGLPLTVGALAGIGTQNAGQFLNNALNPFAGAGDLIPSIDKNINNLGFKNYSNISNKLKNTLNNVDYELSTVLKKLDPFYQKKINQELISANQWQKDWYNNFKTRKRIDNLSEEINNDKIKTFEDVNIYSAAQRNNPEALKDFTQDELNSMFPDIPVPENFSANEWDRILDRINNENYLSEFQTRDSKLQKILKGEERLHEGNDGISGYFLDNTFKGKRQNFVNKYANNVKSTAIHEGNHGLTDGNELIPFKERKNIVKIFGDDAKIPKRNSALEFNSYDEYLQDPTEVYARIMELRKNMGLKPGEILENDKFFNIMKKGRQGKTPVDSRFFELIKNSNEFKNLFNRLPTAALPIGLGAASQFYNGQGEREINQYKDGGKVQPYITNNPNDPRIQKYQDSLQISNRLPESKYNNYVRFMTQNGLFISDSDVPPVFRGIKAKKYSPGMEKKRSKTFVRTDGTDSKIPTNILDKLDLNEGYFMSPKQEVILDYNINANGEFSTPEDYVESVVEQMPIQQTPDFRKYLQPKGFSRQGQSGERQDESFYDAKGKMTGQIINGQYIPTEYGKFLESGMSEDEYLNQVQEFAYGGKINNDMKKKLKKYPAGGYLDYQEGYKGFGVGPQLYQDNSYFRSILPDTIENMEEEINKPSVFSGINNILGGIDQIASKGIGLAGNFMKSKMPGAMGNMEGYEGLSGDAKESFDFNKLLNFAEGKTGSNLIDTDLESIAGRISGGMSGDGQVFGGLLGGGGSKGILQGISFTNQNGGYLRKYQNGGSMDMLPVGSPEYIHKSNVFHENYNPVPRVHFTDDTTPYDMGVNLNDLVNMNGGRINKYQNGGSMDLQGYFNYLTNQNQNRVPSRAFNANTNRASLGALEAANANDFLNTKVRNDRQAFEDDKVDWGFMDWSKDIAAGGLGLLSSVPVLGDTVKDVVGDSFLTRRDGYSVGKGVGNVGMGAAKLVAGIPKGDVSMIMGGIGDIGEGVGSTVGNLNAKSAMRDYNKSGYVSGKRLANAATDFNTTMGLSSKLYGIGSSAVGLAKNPSNKSLNTFLSNQTPFNRANKGQNDLNFLLGQFMPGLNGGGDTGGEMAMGGYLNNYQEGGMVSMPEDFEIPKFKKGGLTPKKAREILHDKSVHGNPLTDKQRKYFGYISSQKKSSGGWLDEI
jgi:hypothetical protein